MRFVDAILSNNSTDDHCREFVKQNGLIPLLKILQLPNLPIDFPTSSACLSVASVCKSILVRQYHITHFHCNRINSKFSSSIYYSRIWLMKVKY